MLLRVWGGAGRRLGGGCTVGVRVGPGGAPGVKLGVRQGAGVAGGREAAAERAAGPAHARQIAAIPAVAALAATAGGKAAAAAPNVPAVVKATAAAAAAAKGGGRIPAGATWDRKGGGEGSSCVQMTARGKLPAQGELRAGSAERSRCSSRAPPLPSRGRGGVFPSLSNLKARRQQHGRRLPFSLCLSVPAGSTRT